jgi:hypothetical protein
MILAKDVLRVLEERIPLRAPEIDWSDRVIWVYAGQRKTVELVKQIIADLEEAPPGHVIKQ